MTEICYAIRCTVRGKVPHDEVYVMCEPPDWPERRAEIMAARPEWFNGHKGDETCSTPQQHKPNLALTLRQLTLNL